MVFDPIVVLAPGAQKRGIDISNPQVKAGVQVYLEELRKQFPVEAKLPGKRVLEMFPVLPKDLSLAVEHAAYTSLNPQQQLQVEQIAEEVFRKERE